MVPCQNEDTQIILVIFTVKNDHKISEHSLYCGTRDKIKIDKIQHHNPCKKTMNKIESRSSSELTKTPHISPSWAASSLTHLPLDKMAAILADDIFNCIFLIENDRILIQISLNRVPRSPIGNKSALVQVMACLRSGDKPLPGPMMTQFTDAYMQH